MISIAIKNPMGDTWNLPFKATLKIKQEWLVLGGGERGEEEGKVLGQGFVYMKIFI